MIMLDFLKWRKQNRDDYVIAYLAEDEDRARRIIKRLPFRLHVAEKPRKRPIIIDPIEGRVTE